MGNPRRRLRIALLLSLLLHLALLSLQFGGEASGGLPGLVLPWQARRIEAPLHIVVQADPVPPVQVTAPPPPPLPQPPPAPTAPVPRDDAALRMIEAAAPGSIEEPESAAIDNEAPPPAPVAQATAPAEPPPATMLHDQAQPSPLPPAAAAASRPASAALPTPPTPAASEPEPAPAPASVEAAPAVQPSPDLAPMHNEAEAIQREEVERKEAERKEEERREAERLEADRRQAQRKEAERKEAERTEAQRKEEERREAERRETERLAAERAEAARAQAEQQASAQREAARREAALAEAARREREQREAQVRQDDERREAARRAMGRQLDEEAARRAAAERDPRPAASSLRRARLWGRSDPNAELVLYAEAFARRVQMNSPPELLREIAGRPHRAPLVTVAIRSDGTVESVSFLVSSGAPEVDDAVRRIVQGMAPFPPFGPVLAGEYDVVEIRRTWQFDSAVRLY